MRTLMIVDDEKNIRLGLSAMISREFPEEYRIELACDGAEALAKLEGDGTDLLITDIRMPKMDGIALMKRIREMDRRPLLLVLSGHDDFAYAKEAIQCEVKGYLLKPIVREELFEALRRLEGELRRQEELSSRLAAGSGRFDALRASQLAYILLHPGMEESEVRERLESVGAGGFGPGWAAGVLRFPAAERPQRLGEAASRPERAPAAGGALEPAGGGQRPVRCAARQPARLHPPASRHGGERGPGAAGVGRRRRLRSRLGGRRAALSGGGAPPAAGGGRLPAGAAAAGGRGGAAAPGARAARQGPESGPARRGRGGRPAARRGARRGKRFRSARGPQLLPEGGTAPAADLPRSAERHALRLPVCGRRGTPL
ncbi:response regulator [Paenibacillus mucilaginosus]|uniref:Response regulatory domain-containing protein n=1 Tax=Paenibacillus mucilaginosus (strain KNP414) TaxID=1036673 RepID=F8FMP5_PAEMK|nr:response regulator [Paenibacillus mucilaginosus]AEI44216.1 hypothetical protein KNP414_05692 [Paenibacillus mucilaginosus KNP414]